MKCGHIAAVIAIAMGAVSAPMASAQRAPSSSRAPAHPIVLFNVREPTSLDRLAAFSCRYYNSQRVTLDRGAAFQYYRSQVDNIFGSATGHAGQLDSRGACDGEASRHIRWMVDVHAMRIWRVTPLPATSPNPYQYTEVPPVRWASPLGESGRVQLLNRMLSSDNEELRIPLCDDRCANFHQQIMRGLFSGVVQHLIDEGGKSEAELMPQLVAAFNSGRPETVRVSPDSFFGERCTDRQITITYDPLSTSSLQEDNWLIECTTLGRSERVSYRAFASTSVLLPDGQCRDVRFEQEGAGRLVTWPRLSVSIGAAALTSADQSTQVRFSSSNCRPTQHGYVIATTVLASELNVVPRETAPPASQCCLAHAQFALLAAVRLEVEYLEWRPSHVTITLQMPHPSYILFDLAVPLSVSGARCVHAENTSPVTYVCDMLPAGTQPSNLLKLFKLLSPIASCSE